MRINIKIFALFVLVALQERVFCEPEPFDLGAITGVAGGLGGGKGLGGPGDSVGGLTKGGAKGLPFLKLFLDLLFKKNVVLNAAKKFKFLYTFLNLTNKLAALIGLSDYRCNGISCTGVAYCFGITKQFALNTSLCAEDEEKTTVSPEGAAGERGQNGGGVPAGNAPPP
ncbi:hypothetical protein Anas_13542 [Armadillidium nasatum]|uniref:Uncharacterized protein n=1 Tax=Armadillidium nasatum TaxID=96803 RepID=A0A5N5TA78_9CRUS|nr:hypothetical protein Anas_13542 [Armadillidium nasatum]